MKGSTVLWIAGGVIVTGAVVYGIYKYLQYQESKTAESTEDTTAAPDVVHDHPRHGQIVAEFEQAQQDVAASIQERHQAAARQLRETLSGMREDSAEFEKRNAQINDDLDKLLE